MTARLLQYILVNEEFSLFGSPTCAYPSKLLVESHMGIDRGYVCIPSRKTSGRPPILSPYANKLNISWDAAEQRGRKMARRPMKNDKVPIAVLE